MRATFATWACIETVPLMGSKRDGHKTTKERLGEAAMVRRPIVDDADVTRMIDFIFGKSLNPTASPEERSQAAYQVTLKGALSRGATKHDGGGGGGGGG